MDPGFVDDLIADLALIDDKGGEQEQDQIDAVGDTTRIRALIVEARALIKSLHTSVINRFRRDPEILAEWATASHIHRTPPRIQAGRRATSRTRSLTLFSRTRRFHPIPAGLARSPPNSGAE